VEHAGVVAGADVAFARCCAAHVRTRSAADGDSGVAVSSSQRAADVSANVIAVDEGGEGAAAIAQEHAILVARNDIARSGFSAANASARIGGAKSCKPVPDGRGAPGVEADGIALDDSTVTVVAQCDAIPAVAGNDVAGARARSPG